MKAHYEHRVAPKRPGQHTDPDGNITEADVSVPSPVADARLLSVFWPTTAATFASRPSIAPLSATAGAGFVLTDGTHTDEVLLHDGSTDHSVEGDLELTGLGAAVSIEAGKRVHLLLLDGTKLARGGHTLIELPVPGTVELAISGTTLVVTGQGVNQFMADAPGVTQVLVNGHVLPFAREGDTAIVPPRGVVPGDASPLSTAEHPTWGVYDAPTNVTWSGTGGWPTSGSGSGSGSSSGSSGSTTTGGGTSGGLTTGATAATGTASGGGTGSTPGGNPGVKGKGCSTVDGLGLLPLALLGLRLRLRRRRS